MFHHGATIPIDAISRLTLLPFREDVIRAVESGARLLSVCAQPLDHARWRLLGVLADSASGELSAVSTEVGDTYPALTPDCPQAHWYEREIFEEHGVQPIGHPWLKPVRFTHSAIGETEFF